MRVQTSRFTNVFPEQTNRCNFYQLEVVDRGSETQLQVGGNFN